MAESILNVRDLRKSFGGIVATDGVSFEIGTDEVHAIIGPNGAGKTTLLAQLCGQIQPDAGSIHFLGKDITKTSTARRARLGLARSFQVTSVIAGFSVLNNVAVAVQANSGSSFSFFASAENDEEINGQALAVLRDTGLIEVKDELAANLAHGQQRQLELAMAIATKPRLLLLDEPMAGMGQADSSHMIEFLRGLKGTYPMLLVEHDMKAVFTLADRISVLVYGKIIASGDAASVRANADVREAYLGDEA